jgi:archaellum component FlaC
MESMRATWTDSRLEEFATKVDHRFDKVDGRLDKVDVQLHEVGRRLDKLDHGFGEVNRRLEKIDVDVREMKAEIAANSRSMLQFCGVMVAAQMATVATLIATLG